MAYESPTPLLTRMALLSPDGAISYGGARRRVEGLISRGYQGALVPALWQGRVTGRLRRGQLVPNADCPLTRTLEAAADIRSTFASWVLVDPLSASDGESRRLGQLAGKRREWLMRNTQGRIGPIGDGPRRSLFSWLNPAYRRFLADLLVELVQAYPISGMVIDLRRLPTPSENPERWYCCSFESQSRAEHALGTGFEGMLAEGNPAVIRRWQDWIAAELGRFLRALRGRTSPIRSDLSWKLLISPARSWAAHHDPWIEALAEGVFDEVIVDLPARQAQASAASFVETVTSLEGRLGHPVLAMPVIDKEESLGEWAPPLMQLPIPGFLVREASWRGGDPAFQLPEAVHRLITPMQDNPLLGGMALLRHVAVLAGNDATSVGRYSSWLADYLGELDPQPEKVEDLCTRLRRMADKVTTSTSLPDGNRAEVLRSIDLLGRLVRLIKPEPHLP